MKPFNAIAAHLASGGMARALRHRDYRIYSLTHFISTNGMWIQRISVGWLTWELTRSGFWLGVIALSEAIPSFLLTPLAGAFADRTDRLRLLRRLVTVNAFGAGALAALTMTGTITIYSLVAIVGLVGTANALAMPARMTMAPGMVPRPDMASAIGLNAILFQLSASIGPAAAGLILVKLGAGFGFAISTAGYLILIVALFFVRLRYEQPVPGGQQGLFLATVEGVRYLFRHSSIGPLILLVLATALLCRPIQDLLPGFADGIFGRGANGLGWLATSFGVGAMLAGGWLAQYGRITGMIPIVLSAVFVFSVAIILFATTSSFALAVMFIGIAGAAATFTSTGSQMLIQMTVDTSMRGRVMSIYGLTWRGMPAIGALGMGAASSWHGLQLPVAAGAAVCLVPWLIAIRGRRRLASSFADEAAQAAAPSGRP